MYNMLFGVNADKDQILAAIGLNESDIFRFRDVFVEDNGRILVYSRGGGGNRQCWGRAADEAGPACDEITDAHHPGCVVPMQERLRAHPLYISDIDDDFDCTYCTFSFKPPSADVLALRNDETRGERQWPLFFAALDALHRERQIP